MMTTVAKAKAFKNRKRERGMASVEAIPLLVIFVMLSAYCVGIFGSIHTGILHSIAARTYAFEIFRNRTNLTVHRENVPSPIYMMNKSQIRFHAINDESAPPGATDWYVARRPLSVGFPSQTVGTTVDHVQRIYNLQPRNQAVAVGPLWIMVGYGMCLNLACGN